MTKAEIRAVMIEFARLQRGGRLGNKYIRDNKNTPAIHGDDRGHAGGTRTRVAFRDSRIASRFPAYGRQGITATQMVET